MSRSYKDSKKIYNEAYEKRHNDMKRAEERRDKEAQRKAWFTKEDQPPEDDEARRGR